MPELDTQNAALESQQESQGQQSDLQSSEAPQDSGDKRLFTQEQVNYIVAQNKRALREEVKAQGEALKKLTDQLDALQSRIHDFFEHKTAEPEIPPATEQHAASQPPPADATRATPPRDASGRFTKAPDQQNPQIRDLHRQLDQMMRRTEELTRQIEEERRKRIEAEIERREAARDSLIASALSRADVYDVDFALPYFKNKTRWDEDTQQWIYTTKDGLDTTIEEGVIKELPPFLRKPKTTKTGSGGTHQQGPGAQTASAELQSLRQKLDEARALAQRTGNTNDIAMVTKLKTELTALERSLRQQGQPV
ncbi:MAG: hypothetical protein Q9M19_04910 [Mariprofundaceae bacterium]|nr:hypothetical protein [Mariprofundaceae bacterium]